MTRSTNRTFIFFLIIVFGVGFLNYQRTKPREQKYEADRELRLKEVEYLRSQIELAKHGSR